MGLLACVGSRPSLWRIEIDRYFRRSTPEANLKRKELRAHLRKLGFEKSNDGALMPPSSSKDTIRTLHQDQRNAILKTQRDFVLDMLPRLTRYFANGNEIDPTKIAPKIELIKADTWQAELFRLASLCWSVPVSAGFGRRLRYLVWDNHNDKLIGLMALGDPSSILRFAMSLLDGT